MKENWGNFAALVIGDCENLRGLLESHGVGKVYQMNDEDAVSPGPRFACDVVLLEWKPDSGAATLYKARAGGRFTSSAPIIAISNDLDECEVKVAHDAGVADILTGSLDAPEVFSRVTTVLARARIFVHTETYYGPDRRQRGPQVSLLPCKWRQEDLELLRGRPLGLRRLRTTSSVSLNISTPAADSRFN